MEGVVSELFIKGQFYKGIIEKRPFLWSFSYNSFVKFHGKIFGSHNMTLLDLNVQVHVIMQCHRKGLHRTVASPWVKVFRIIPEFRILKLTFHRKSAPKF